MRRHAVKQVRRYRYTIEQRLVQDGGVGTKGVRYGAEEVDKAGLAILQRFLNSPAEIVAAVPPRNSIWALITRILCPCVSGGGQIRWQDRGFLR